jgi:hypothetical protein
MKRLLDTKLPDDVRRVLQSAEEDARPIAIARLERSLHGMLGASSISGVSLRADAAGATPSLASVAQVAPVAPSGVPLASAALGTKVVIALAALGTLGALGALALRSGSAARHTATHGHAKPALAPTVAAHELHAPAGVAPSAVPAAAPAAAIEPAPIAIAPVLLRAGSGSAPALRGGASSRSRPTHGAASQLSDEVRQLDAIRRYLRTDTARALAAADAHERRFPNGALSEERELLRIEALFRLGRNTEAQMRAERLIASPAGKAYRRQVQRLIARYTQVAGG